MPNKRSGWKIGIERPDPNRGGIEDIIEISNMGMATSGDYRNYYEKDGIRYTHIIDAQTGRPVTHHTTSVTVLTENAMLADAWATAFLALGSERGLEIAEEQKLATLFIVRNDPKSPLKYTQLSSSEYDKLSSGSTE